MRRGVKAAAAGEFLRAGARGTRPPMNIGRRPAVCELFCPGASPGPPRFSSVRLAQPDRRGESSPLRKSPPLVLPLLNACCSARSRVREPRRQHGGLPALAPLRLPPHAKTRSEKKILARRVAMSTKNQADVFPEESNIRRSRSLSPLLARKLWPRDTRASLRTQSAAPGGFHVPETARAGFHVRTSFRAPEPQAEAAP